MFNRLLSILLKEGPSILVRKIKNRTMLTYYPKHEKNGVKIKNLKDYKDKISIIIPTKDKLFVLKNCLNSIIHNTDYKNFEIILIDNKSNKKTKRFLKSLNDKKIKILEFNQEFNFSKVCNLGASLADSNYLLFLNNDTEIIDKNWIKYMVMGTKIKRIGAVGCKLLFPNNRIQHNGIILNPEHICQHIDYLKEDYKESYDAKYVSAVTAACLLIKKDIFKEINGFDETLPLINNDIDLCLKLHKLGYSILCINKPLLYHYESLTRGKTYSKQSNNYIKNKWKNELMNDNYYKYDIKT